MLTYSSSLLSSLASAVSKVDWCNKVIAALGNTRRIRCFRDANASAANPFATGTEFLNIGSSGTIAVSAGNIVGMGLLSGTTIKLATDLTTGACIVRIEGNGQWIQGTLGLPGSGTDFTLSTNVTTATGFGFASAFQIKAPQFLPSGIGTAAPARTMASPKTIEFYNWTNSSNPTLGAIVNIDKRIDDFVFQDTEMQTSNGDTGVYQSSQDVTFGNFKIGATMTISAAQSSDENTAPLHQVAVPFAYVGAEWTGYPDAGTGYDRKNSILNLPPFKAILKDGNGNILYTWQSPDGSPLNDPAHFTVKNGQPNRLDASNANKPLQANVNTQQTLFWESATPRLSDIAHKVYPGIDTTKYRPSKGRIYFSYVGCEPGVSGSGNNGSGSINGQGHIWMAPQYPLPPKAIQINDQYVGPDMNNGGGSAPYSGWIEGYDYVPGGFGLHTKYTGPGGPRHDRCVYPSPFAYYLSYPNAVQDQNNVPWKAIAHGYRKNYFSQEKFHVKSPSTLFWDTNANLINSIWSAKYNYYGEYPYTGPAVVMNGDQNDGTTDRNFDANGNLILNGRGLDGLHDYSNIGMPALLYNSPMHAIFSKFDTAMSFLIHGPANTDMSHEYLVRDMAWQWMHHVIAWKLGTNHPLGFSQAEIEARFCTVLQAVYDCVYKPAFIDNSQEPRFAALRNLGVIVDPNSNGYWWTPGGRLGFYMSHVLVLMKQTGFWNRIYNMNATNKTVLDNLIRNMDKFVFDSILDSNGGTSFAAYYFFGQAQDSNGNLLPGNVPTSWAAFQSAGYIPAANDFIHQNDPKTGNPGYYSADTDVSVNLWRGYAYMRPIFFSEYPNARMNDAIAKFDQYEATVTSMVNAATSLVDKSKADHIYEYPGVAVLKAPN